MQHRRPLFYRATFPSLNVIVCLDMAQNYYNNLAIANIARLFATAELLVLPLRHRFLLFDREYLINGKSGRYSLISNKTQSCGCWIITDCGQGTVLLQPTDRHEASRGLSVTAEQAYCGQPRSCLSVDGLTDLNRQLSQLKDIELYNNVKVSIMLIKQEAVLSQRGRAMLRVALPRAQSFIISIPGSLFWLQIYHCAFGVTVDVNKNRL